MARAAKALPLLPSLPGADFVSPPLAATVPKRAEIIRHHTVPPVLEALVEKRPKTPDERRVQDPQSGKAVEKTRAEHNVIQVNAARAIANRKHPVGWAPADQIRKSTRRGVLYSCAKRLGPKGLRTYVRTYVRAQGAQGEPKVSPR